MDKELATEALQVANLVLEEVNNLVSKVIDVTECLICRDMCSDPVRMTCAGQHVFCFHCMFKNFEYRKFEELCCPTCRHPSGSLIMEKKLGDISASVIALGKMAVPSSPSVLSDSVVHTGNSKNKEVANYVPHPTTQMYMIMIPVLKLIFIEQFERAEGSCVITAVQMALFVKNYEALCDICITSSAHGLSVVKIKKRFCKAKWNDIYGNPLHNGWLLNSGDQEKRTRDIDDIMVPEAPRSPEPHPPLTEPPRISPTPHGIRTRRRHIRRFILFNEEE